MSQVSFSPRIRPNKLSHSDSPASEGYPTIAKAALLESRRIAVEENRHKLFSEEKKQNMVKLNINKNCSREFVEQLCNQHRIQVQKLLLEISRLHDLVEDLERQNRHQINRIKQESEQMALMRISTLRQCQLEEVETIQTQMKAYKKNYLTLEQEYDSYKASVEKKLQQLTRESRQQKDTIKKLVEEKNNQIYSIKKKNEKELEKVLFDKENQMDDLKESLEKEIRKIRNKLEGREKEIDILKEFANDERYKFEEIEVQLIREKEDLFEKVQESMLRHKRKQEETVKNLKKFYEELMENQQAEKQITIEDFKKEIDQLLSIIRLKNQEIERNTVYRETQKLEYKFLQDFFQKEIKFLKQSLKKQRTLSLQETELLKTKMALLHENDIQSLTKLYEKRIDDLVVVNRRAEQLLDETETKLIDEKKIHYQEKKKYDYKISKLQEQIIRLRLGMGTIEHEMKQKIENEKSMLLLTSKNFIKEVQIKTANCKYHEEELRKLRYLLDMQENQIEEEQNNVEEKIKQAEDELNRLSNKILEIKAEAAEAEQKFKGIIKSKDQQIRRLNDLLNIPEQKIEHNLEEREEIVRLQKELNKKMDELGSTRMKCQELEEYIRMLKAEGERLMIEAQINSEDAKKHYKEISDKNLSDMKFFYERRIRELENDKKELEKINSSQSEHITELIKKYKEAEQALKEFIKQSKKRGDLQHRIIQIGMDQNLVKNMAQLFKR